MYWPSGLHATAVTPKDSRRRYSNLATLPVSPPPRPRRSSASPLALLCAATSERAAHRSKTRDLVDITLRTPEHPTSGADQNPVSWRLLRQRPQRLLTSKLADRSEWELLAGSSRAPR